MPRDEAAFFHPGGICAGGFLLPVGDALFLVRTGFPVCMEAWQMADGAQPGDSRGEAGWLFEAGGDTTRVNISAGSIFPDEIAWGGGGASILSSSVHDEYRAWPASWRIESGNVTAVLEISSFDSSAEPWPELWSMDIPVPVDTLESSPVLTPAWRPMIR